MQKSSHVSHFVKLSWGTLGSAETSSVSYQEAAVISIPWWEKAPLLSTISWGFACLLHYPFCWDSQDQLCMCWSHSPCTGTISCWGPGSLAQRGIVYSTQECAGKQGPRGALQSNMFCSEQGEGVWVATALKASGSSQGVLVCR